MNLLRRLILGSFLLQMLLPPLPTFAQRSAQSLRERAIEYVTDSGMMSSNSGAFLTEEPMTRIDFLSILVNDVYYLDDQETCFSEISSRPGLSVRYTHLFADVHRKAPFAGSLCIGMMSGLVQGRQDGTFGAGTAISFAEAAKWITKAYGIAPMPSLRPNPTIPWYEPYRYAVARHGAVPMTVKNVQQRLTKGEAAELLYLLRTEKPSYGYRYRQNMPTPQKIFINTDFDISPVQSLRVRFVSPSDKGGLTIKTLQIRDQIATFGHMTTRTRRALIRNGASSSPQRAQTEAQKSDLTRAVSRLREPTPLGRDWKFIDPKNRPTARSVHQAAESYYRERTR